MKAYKCPICGFLDIPIGEFGACHRDCPECESSMFLAEYVEIIDWEKELLTKTE